VTSHVLNFRAKTEPDEKNHRFKWEKNTKFGFLRKLSGFDARMKPSLGVLY